MYTHAFSRGAIGVMLIAILATQASAVPGEAQAATLLTSEVEAGGVGEVRINLSFPINRVEIYLESLEVGEYVGGGTGPLTVKFFVPPHIPPGTYTLYIRIFYVTEVALNLITEEASIIVYRSVEPDLEVKAPLVVAPSDVVEGFIAAKYGSRLVDAGPVRVTILSISEDGLVEESSTAAVRVDKGVYLFSIRAPSQEGIYILRVEAAGLDLSLLRVRGSVELEPLIVASPAGVDLEVMLEEINKVRVLLEALIVDLEEGKQEILDSLEAHDLSAAEALQELASSLDSVEAKIDELSQRIVVIDDGVSRIIGLLREVNDKIIVIETGLGEIKASIDEVGSAIEAVNGEVVSIKTSIGEVSMQIYSIIESINSIEENLLSINTVAGEIRGVVVEVRDGVARIETGLGDLSVNLAKLGAEIVRIDNDIAVVKSDVGTIRVGIEKLGVDVINLGNDVVLIKTGLNDLIGIVEGVEEGIAIISTNVGELRVELSRFRDDVAAGLNALNAGFEDLSRAERAESEDLDEIKRELDALREALLGLEDLRARSLVAGVAGGLLSGLLVALAVAIIFRRVI